jgi:hypothetical protein
MKHSMRHYHPPVSYLSEITVLKSQQLLEAGSGTGD